MTPAKQKALTAASTANEGKSLNRVNGSQNEVRTPTKEQNMSSISDSTQPSNRWLSPEAAQEIRSTYQKLGIDTGPLDAEIADQEAKAAASKRLEAAQPLLNQLRPSDRHVAKTMIRRMPNLSIANIIDSFKPTFPEPALTGIPTWVENIGDAEWEMDTQTWTRSLTRWRGEDNFGGVEINARHSTDIKGEVTVDGLDFYVAVECMETVHEALKVADWLRHAALIVHDSEINQLLSPDAKGAAMFDNHVLPVRKERRRMLPEQLRLLLDDPQNEELMLTKAFPVTNDRDASLGHWTPDHLQLAIQDHDRQVSVDAQESQAFKEVANRVLEAMKDKNVQTTAELLEPADEVSEA